MSANRRAQAASALNKDEVIVAAVTLLGNRGAVEWPQTQNALVIQPDDRDL